MPVSKTMITELTRHLRAMDETRAFLQNVLDGLEFCNLYVSGELPTTSQNPTKGVLPNDKLD